jgi:DNA polymerase sigma
MCRQRLLCAILSRSMIEFSLGIDRQIADVARENHHVNFGASLVDFSDDWGGCFSYHTSHLQNQSFKGPYPELLFFESI